jgi:acyl-phosphate glycerol 3-phosphate acyltransferase
MTIWLALPLCYLLGSIPTAVWVSRLFAGIDIREHGSHNAGLTNVYRVLGWKPAVPVAIVDLLKGLGAVLLGLAWSKSAWNMDHGHQTFALGCGVAAVVGHSFTVFAGFRGGKGVLTMMGVFTGVSTAPALISFGFWVLVLRKTGFVSLASILASAFFAIAETVVFALNAVQVAAEISVGGEVAWFALLRTLVSKGHMNLLILSWIMAVFVIWKHRANIQRLRNGTEYRFGSAREDDEELVDVDVAKQDFARDARAAGLDPDRVAIIGAGSWGMAIAQILSSKGLKVTLWEYSATVADKLRETRELPDKLPGVKLLDSVEITSDLAKAVDGAATVCLIVPSHTLRSVCKNMGQILTPEQVASRHWVSFIKGIEEKTLKRMTEIVMEVLPGATPRPTFPCCPVLRMPRRWLARCPPRWWWPARTRNAAALQDIFFLVAVLPHLPQHRCGGRGALRCGQERDRHRFGHPGRPGLGDNTRGALMTRGMVEMSRLGEKMGGNRESFFGLAGMGDLITTCVSKHSRNRHVGEQVGKGKPLSEVLSGMTMVAEGVRTVAGVRELARIHKRGDAPHRAGPRGVVRWQERPRFGGGLDGPRRPRRAGITREGLVDLAGGVRADRARSARPALLGKRVRATATAQGARREPPVPGARSAADPAHPGTPLPGTSHHPGRPQKAC